VFDIFITIISIRNQTSLLAWVKRLRLVFEEKEEGCDKEDERNEQ